MTPEEKKIAVAMFRSGMSFSEVAALYGVTRNVIAGLCQRANERLPADEWRSRLARGQRLGGLKRPRHIERDREIIAAWSTGLWTKSQLARHFKLTPARIHQIINAEASRQLEAA